MIRQAIIPLAGLGTRLMPLTSVYPKELLPINGKIGLEYILEECVDAGIKEMQQFVDTLIVIPNQNLFRIANEKTTFADAFAFGFRLFRSFFRCATSASDV